MLQAPAGRSHSGLETGPHRRDPQDVLPARDVRGQSTALAPAAAAPRVWQRHPGAGGGLWPHTGGHLGPGPDDQSWSHQAGREVVIGGPLVRRHRALPRMNSIPEYAYMGRASPLTGAGGGGTLMLPEQPRPSGLPGGSALGLETCPRHLPGPWSLPKTPSPPAFPSRGVLPHPTEDLSRAHTHRHMGTFMGHTRLPS